MQLLTRSPRFFLASLTVSFLLAPLPQAEAQPVPQPPTVQRAAHLLSSQPLHFETLAQTSVPAHYIATGPGYGVRLAPDEVAVTLFRNPSPGRALSDPDTVQLTMKLTGANPAAAAEELESLHSTSSYFLGSDPAAWRSGVPQFARLRYRGVYPGIDVFYYGNGTALEHDFVLEPHADPSQLRFRFDGVSPHLAPSGDLLLKPGPDARNALRLLRPTAYQPATANEPRREIDARFNLLADGSVRFALGDYDPTRTLVIDPTLAYASYFGNYNTVINGIALDAGGNIFIAGVAPNYGFTKKNAPFSGGNTTFSAFLAKLDPTGANVLFAGFIGGSAQDEGLALALDPSGNAYIAGLTQSANFPTLHAAQATYGVSSCYSSFVKCFNGFVTAVKSDGSALLYSTYLGGSVDDRAEGIAVDSTGAAYVTGYTKSGNFPLLHAYQSTLNTNCTSPSNGSCQDAFVTKLDSTGALVFSSYLGGTAVDNGYAIALDAAKNIYLTGQAGGGNFPNTNTLVNNGSHLTSTSGAFVTEMAADGQSLIFSDVVGSGFGTALAVDSTGIYMTGANSGNLPNVPTTTGAYSSTQSGTYALKLKPDGSAFLYSTYIGGILNDQPNAIAVDTSGDAFIAGYTTSATFPTTSNALQATSAGGFLHSSDSGGTFTGASSGLGNCSPVFLSIDPAHSGNILTGCTSALYLSTNSSASWTQVATTGLPSTIVTGFRTVSNSATLYILGTTGVYKSTDNGVTWTKGTGTGLPTLNGTSQEIVGDPANAAVIYFSHASVGQPLVFRSADSGNTWAGISTGLPSTGNLSFLVPDNSNAGTLYAAIGAKVYKTTSSGATWALPNSTGVPYAIRGLSLDPSNSSTLYVGTSLGYFKSTDGASTFTAGNSSFVNAATITVDPTNSNNLYAGILDAGFYAIKKSTDGGTTFTATPFVNAPPSIVVIDPASHTNLYVGSSPTPTAFLTELDPTGASLLYSSYYGGIGWTEFNALTLDSSGNPLVAGMSNSTTNTTTNSGAQPSFAASQPALTPSETAAQPEYALNLTSSGSSTTGPFTGTVAKVNIATVSPTITVALTDVVNPVAVAMGGAATYTLTATASGGTAINVALSWTPPPNNNGNSYVFDPGPFTCDSGVCRLASLAPGVQASVVIVLPVYGPNIPLPPNNILVDSATLRASNASNSAQANAPLTVTAGPYLSLSSSLSGPLTVSPDHKNVTSTFNVPVGMGADLEGTLSNIGNVAANNVAVNTTFDAPLGPVFFPGPSPQCQGTLAISCVLPTLPPTKLPSDAFHFSGSAIAKGPAGATGTASLTATAANASTVTSAASIPIIAAQSDIGVRIFGYTGSLGFNGNFQATNAGSYNGIADSTASFTLTATVSAGLLFTGADPLCTGIGSNTLTCQATLAPGKQHFFAYRLDENAPASFSLTATASNQSPIDPDSANDSVTLTVNAFATPKANVWVADSSAGISISPHLAFPALGVPHFSAPGSTSVAFDIAGNAWVGGNSVVKEFSSSGVLLQTFSGNGIGTVAGVSIDGLGNVWIANTNGTVVGLTNDGSPITATTAGVSGGGLNQPTGIAVDNAGTIWVTNSGNNSVTRIFGAAAPAATPLSTSLTNGNLGVLP